MVVCSKSVPPPCSSPPSMAFTSPNIFLVYGVHQVLVSIVTASVTFNIIRSFIINISNILHLTTKNGSSDTLLAPVAIQFVSTTSRRILHNRWLPGRRLWQ